MGLFWKIFLWFLLAMAAVVGVSVFVSWSTQNEPFRERWQINVISTINLYTDTAKQIYEKDGEDGVRQFLQTVKNYYPNREVCLAKDLSCFASMNNGKTDKLIERAKQTANAEIESRSFEENYAAKKFVTTTGEENILVLKMDFPRPPPPFGTDWTTRIIRISAILLTAGVVCYLLILYLISPILRLQQAVKKLADGDLKTRIESKRRDELGQLSRDFDEMAERIEALITSQQRLTRDVSHELRSPLARMNVALELAKVKSGKESQALIERIETESQRLNEMISNILTLSKLESKAETIEKNQVNLTKLIETVVEDTNFEAQAKGKSVVLLEKEKAVLSGNERLLRSAIENVLRNAIRYTKNRVEATLEAQNGAAVITIRDYGEGIPEKDLREIFRPFYRVSEARERKSGGIGIGLSITEQAVHAHHGTVTAKNEPDGLKVEIKLPLNGNKG
jgi:signal transduction histidine kinase